MFHGFILSLLFYLVLVSCISENAVFIAENGEDIMVQFTIHSSAESSLKLTNRNQLSHETVIHDISILIFSDDKFQYIANGIIKSSTYVSTTFSAELKTSSKPLTLLFIANSKEVIEGADIRYSEEKEVVQSKLTSLFTDIGIHHTFPMSGEYQIPFLVSGGNNIISGIKIVRSIARADILIDDAVTNFDLVSVQLFRANNKIRIVPDVITNSVISSPTLPDDAQANIATQPLTVTDNKSESQLYISESVAPGLDERVSEATCIVIGGKYEGSSVPTYYRIDFNPGIDGHPFGQILRNHKYVFSIKNVSVIGDETPDEAANSQSKGIIVEVETWDENIVDMWFEGETFFSVSSRTMFLRPWASTFRQFYEISVNTNLPSYSVQWSDFNGNPLPGSSFSETCISNEDYTVSILKGVIKVEAKTNNELPAERSSYFVIHAGRWDIVIKINQYGLSKHMNDLIRVVSFYGIGTPGNGYANETNDADALALRQILNKQFCPEGLFKFGGYHFTVLPKVTTSSNLSSTVLSNYDVVYLPYNQQQNQTTTYTILEWLNAKPNRVLIISADDNSTNVNLLSAAGDNLRWNYATSGTTYFDFIVNDNNGLFTKYGLFGNVSATSKYRSYDGIWGRATHVSNQVIPLLANSDGDMLLGVNMHKRIVYIGESQFNYAYTGGLSSNTGEITNDNDRLMANLWAWITEIVLSGK